MNFVCNENLSPVEKINKSGLCTLLLITKCNTILWLNLFQIQLFVDTRLACPCNFLPSQVPKPPINPS